MSPTQVRHTDQTGSTNADARAAFDAAEDGPLWFVTDRQTGGVGRRGREWWHGEGNFAGTLLLPIRRENLAKPSAFSFLAGLAVIDALEALGLPQQRYTLKWPNDVLQDGAKVSGILCELFMTPDRLGVAIGIGVNLRSAPPAMPYAVAAVSSIRPGIDRDAFLGRLDHALLSRWSDYQVEGFDALRQEWLQYAAGLNQPVQIRSQGQELAGTFSGIGPEGELLLEMDGKIHAISAADVFIGGV